MLNRMQKKSFIIPVRRMATHHQSNYASPVLSVARSYYDVLKVPMNSSGSDIKRAFIELSKKYHPDGNSGTRDSDEFVRVCEAYKILYKRASRDHYNNRLKTRFHMVQPADISYTNKNVHKTWARYQASMRYKQFGYDLKSFGGASVPHKKLLVLKQPEKKLSVVKTETADDIHMPFLYEQENFDNWMYKCYMTGFSLVGVLLAFDAMKRLRKRHSNQI